MCNKTILKLWQKKKTLFSSCAFQISATIYCENIGVFL